MNNNISRNTLKKAHKLLITAVITALCCTSAFAQQISPKLLNEVELEFPGIVDREALVEVEFTVTSDGAVSSPEVVGGFYESRFVEAALEAVNKMQFSPATQSGEAVDWPGFRISARFVYKDLMHAMFPDSNSKLREVENLISAKDFDSAEERVLDLLENDTRLYFENAMFNLRLAEIYISKNRITEAAHAVNKALQTYYPGEHEDFSSELAKTHDRINVFNIVGFNDDNFRSTTLIAHYLDHMPQESFRAPSSGGQRVSPVKGADNQEPKKSLEVLSNKLLASAYLRAFVIHSSLGNINALVDISTKLEALSKSAITDGIERQTQMSMDMANSDQTIRSNHIISEGQEIIYPVHRIVAATAVDGNIESLDIQCETRSIRLEFQEEVEWNLPESWGQCALRFRGDSGASFALVEFAN